MKITTPVQFLNVVTSISATHGCDPGHFLTNFTKKFHEKRRFSVDPADPRLECVACVRLGGTYLLTVAFAGGMRVEATAKVRNYRNAQQQTVHYLSYETQRVSYEADEDVHNDPSYDVEHDGWPSEAQYDALLSPTPAVLETFRKHDLFAAR